MSFKDSPNLMGSYPDDWPEKIRKLLIPGSVLDVCGGAGRFTHLFGDRDYTCVDINKDLVIQGSQIYPEHTWVHSDINDFEWKDYDNVFSWVGLQHVEHPDFEAIRKHAKNLILCECTKLPEKSDYMFAHDWKKEFPGIKDLGTMVDADGYAHLMNWRPDESV